MKLTVRKTFTLEMSEDEASVMISSLNSIKMATNHISMIKLRDAALNAELYNRVGTIINALGELQVLKLTIEEE